MHDTPDDQSGMHSRSRPRDPIISALRGLRSATRDYIVVAEATLRALDALEGHDELVYLRAALAVACGRRGAAFGTPFAIEKQISALLGEEPS